MKRDIIYYYSAKYGVGLGDVQTAAGEKDIFFEDGQRRTVPGKSVVSLTNILRSDVYSAYSYSRRYDSVRYDGKQLYLDGKVMPVKESPSHDMHSSFRIGSTPEEVVSIYTGRYEGYSDLQCSCASRTECEHKAAVRTYFREHLKILRDAYVDSETEPDKSLFPSARLSGLLDGYFNEHEGRETFGDRMLKLPPIIDEMLLHPVIPYIAAALDYIFSKDEELFYSVNYEERIDQLAAAMCAQPSLCECISRPGMYEEYQEISYYSSRYKNIRAAFKRAVKNSRDAAKELASGNYSHSEWKKTILSCKGDYRGLLLYYSVGAEDMEFGTLKEIADLEGKIVTEASDGKTLIPAVKKLLKALDETGYQKEAVMKAFNVLLSLLPQEEVIPVLSELRHLGIGMEEYRKLSPESQKLLAKSMPAEKAAMEYILSRVLDDAEPKEIAEYIICTLYKTETRAQLRELEPAAAAAVAGLPHNTLLKEFLDFYLYGKEYKGKKQKIKLTEEDYTAYCRLDAEVSIDDEQVITTYSCSFGEGDADWSPSLIRMDKGIMYHRGFLDRFTEDSLMLIIKLALRGREKEIKKLEEESRARIEKDRFIETHRVFAAGYEELRRKLSSDKIILTDSFKVRITYFLYVSEGMFMLAFKVGNVRDYVVRNAEDFLEAFITKKTVTYGKDLVLTHDFENLNEEDRKVIQTLSGLHMIEAMETAYRKCVYIENEALAAFLEMMQGRVLFFNEEPCTVRLDKREVRICVNKDYEIGTDLDPEKQIFFAAGDRGYVYDKSEKAIDSVVGDAYRVWVTEFCEENRGTSVRPIIADFRKDIYSGNEEAFDIAPTVQHSFKLDTVKIRAYFDYEDKKILLREELFKDDKKVKRQDLTGRGDLDRLKNFDAYISRLGFEDNAITDESRVMSFFKMDFSGLKKLANVYLSENISNKSVLTVNRSVVRVRTAGSGIMEAFMEKSEYSEEELEKILQGIRRKKKYIFLDKDRIVDLDSAQARELGEVVKDLGLTPGSLYEKKRISMVNALKAFAHSENCSVDRHLRNMMEEIRNFKEYEAADPGTRLPLRSYQTDGYRWLTVLSANGMGGILADDMGLGKTLQIIALIKQDRKKAPSLIVCPKSLVFNWMNEFAKFDGVTETAEIYGPAPAREDIIRGIDYKKKTVYITSYDSLRNDIAFYTGKFAYCILDEAQFIKNVDALKSRSVKEIKAEHRFALTGTPIENSVADLWSIFDFIMPGYFEELSEFRSEYNKDPDYTAKIARRIGPFVLRRIKENVLSDLPDKYEKIISTEMTREQRKLYDAVRKKAKDRLEGGGKAFDLLPYLTQMRQICVDPEMCFEGRDTGSGKMDLLRTIVPEYLEGGHRILIFSQFVKGLNRVEELLGDMGIGYYMITGDTGAKDRIEMIEEFNSGSGTDVFLVSLKAGGTGINLTGADTVIHLDPWWNVAAENQATDRAHRIGQTRNVEVIKLISENSIEQRVIELQNLKKDLFDRVISNDDSSVTGARLEDIAFILR